MITMIVMGIITMLNDLAHNHDFFVGLFSGGVSSFLVTLFFWWVTTRLFAPRLEISRDIALVVQHLEQYLRGLLKKI